MSYRISLQPPLANFHDVFHVSRLRRYILDLSLVIQVDDIHVRENLNVEASLVRIKGREVKHLHGNDITLVKVVWEEPAGGSITWELLS